MNVLKMIFQFLIINTMNKTEAFERIVEKKYLPNFTSEEIDYIIHNVGATGPLPKGFTLFEKGDFGDDIFFIIKGKIKITLEENTDREKNIIIPSGQWIGELSVIDTGKTRSATATAETNTTFWRIHEKALEALKHPEVNKTIEGLEEAIKIMHISRKIHESITLSIIQKLRASNKQ
jgi:CRP-like cAMP-binding protein